MGLQFNSLSSVDNPEYFIYLKSGKILKSIFDKHPQLTGIALLLAIFYLKRAGVDLNKIKQLGGKLLQIHKRINALVVRFSDYLTPEHIKFLEEVLNAEIKPVKQVRALLNTSVHQIGLVEAVNKYGLDGSGVTVAVIDTGINDTHEDIRGRVIARKRFVDGGNANSLFFGDFIDKIKSMFNKQTTELKLDGNGHGTHCAVVVGGSGEVYKGVAPKVALIDAKVLSDKGSGSDAGVVRGMSWAASQGADVISLSLGTAGGDPDDAVCREANALAEDGIIVVVAAGNEGPSLKTIGSPGAAEKVITVGAVDKENKITKYSSRGPVVAKNARNLFKPDIVAPGGGTKYNGSCSYSDGIISGKSPEVGSNGCTLKDNRGVQYQKMSGTSMATPHIAGVCALLVQASGMGKDKKDRCEIIKQVLKATAKNLNVVYDWQGAGLVDVNKAVELIKKNTISGKYV